MATLHTSPILQTEQPPMEAGWGPKPVLYEKCMRGLFLLVPFRAHFVNPSQFGQAAGNAHLGARPRTLAKDSLLGGTGKKVIPLRGKNLIRIGPLPAQAVKFPNKNAAKHVFINPAAPQRSQSTKGMYE